MRGSVNIAWQHSHLYIILPPPFSEICIWRYWSKQGFRNSPSFAVDSISNCFSLYACYFSPFRHAVSFTVMCDISATSAISLLPLNGYPSTICRRVIAVRVNSIDCKPLRITGCVCPTSEIIKDFPFLAYANPSTTIPFEVFIARIVAALLHCTPYIVKLCSISRPIFGHRYPPTQKIYALQFLPQTPVIHAMR